MLRGIVEHAAGERPQRPGGPLVLLVRLYVEELVEERSEAEGLDPQELCRNASVGDVVDVPAIILVQQPQVVVGVMKDHLDLRVEKNLPEPFGHAYGKRVDDRALVARGYLEEIDS